MNCEKCNVNVYHRTGIGELYMVHDSIWNDTIYYFQHLPQYLCIECLEYIIDRKLNPLDFVFCPLNFDMRYYRSKRLINRLTRFEENGD